MHCRTTGPYFRDPVPTGDFFLCLYSFFRIPIFSVNIHAKNVKSVCMYSAMRKLAEAKLLISFPFLKMPPYLQGRVLCYPCLHIQFPKSQVLVVLSIALWTACFAGLHVLGTWHLSFFSPQTQFLSDLHMGPNIFTLAYSVFIAINARRKFYLADKERVLNTVRPQKKRKIHHLWVRRIDQRGQSNLRLKTQ